VSAVVFATSQSKAKRFLIILGDILCSFNVDIFLQEWAKSNKQAAVIVHPSTHPFDSDAAFNNFDGKVIVKKKTDDKSEIPNMSSTGIFGLTIEGIKKYGHLSDIGSDLIAEAASNNDLFCWVDSHYFKDTGTPERLFQARKDIETGVFQRRGSIRNRPAIFLDRDGVINSSFPEYYSEVSYRTIPGVPEAISSINSAGIPIFTVTNQPGLAKGFMTQETHMKIRSKLDHILSLNKAFCDEYVFCPHHPEKGFKGEVLELKNSCNCRKPKPGLILDLSFRHGIDTRRSIMVGDTWRDYEVSNKLGMRFIHVSNNRCQLSPNHECFTESVTAIMAAKEGILKL
jgi:histidinol-phosphate phosphatase family protein